MTRLTKQRQDNHAAFQRRDLSQTDHGCYGYYGCYGCYGYVWADRVHPTVQLGQAHSYVLVLLGVRLDGTKELIALADGLRESTVAVRRLLWGWPCGARRVEATLCSSAGCC